MSTPYTEDHAELHDALCRLGLVGPDERVRFEPLTGGVSSDILLVTTAKRQFCLKRALSRLKVAAVWEAPISRNAAEAAWLRQVGEWFPDNVPAVIAADATAGLFAMDFLPSDAYPVWKTQLSTGVIDVDFASKVGELVCAIHRKSAGNATLAQAFSNDDTFEPIRLSPYFRATALVHPSLASQLNALADKTLSTKRALVHGDVSPKNILCGPKGPVLLDAECAWYGDPAFDLAFCLNHLLLKSTWHPQWSQRYMQSFTALSNAYLKGIDWEPVEAFERRCAALLPAMALARVDGKSPVEYLTENAQKERVRNAAIDLILNPVDTLDAVGAAWLRNSHV